jgi:hypothetical protein
MDSLLIDSLSHSTYWSQCSGQHNARIKNFENENGKFEAFFSFFQLFSASVRQSWVVSHELQPHLFSHESFKGHTDTVTDTITQTLNSDLNAKYTNKRQNK